MEALTGASNFDICESMILKMISVLSGTRSTIAMLCKTSVARNIFVEMKRSQIPFHSCDIFEFNAKKVFGINANACLLLIDLNDRSVSPDYCEVYSFDKPEKLINKIFYRDGKLQNQAIRYCYDFSGESCLEWRQGVKAYTAMLILNSEHVQNYLCSIAFLDSKRPFTKKVLEQIDFHKVLDVSQMTDFVQTEKRLGLEHKMNEDMLEGFQRLLEMGQMKLPLRVG